MPHNRLEFRMVFLLFRLSNAAKIYCFSTWEQSLYKYTPHNITDWYGDFTCNHVFAVNKNLTIFSKIDLSSNHQKDEIRGWMENNL